MIQASNPVLRQLVFLCVCLFVGHMVARYYCFTLVVSVYPSFECISSIFLFPDDNLSKISVYFHQTWYVETWFGIAEEQILSIFHSYLPTKW